MAFTYDGASNLTEQSNPRTGSFDTHLDYDDLNRVVRSEDAVGNVTAMAHDEAGNVLCEQRPLGVAARGNVARGFANKQPVAALVALLCAASPPATAQVTQHRYDELGKLVETTDALAGKHSFIYDAQRNLIGKQDARGNLTTYEFNARNLRTFEHQWLSPQQRLTDASGRGLVATPRGLPPPGNSATLQGTMGACSGSQNRSYQTLIGGLSILSPRILLDGGGAVTDTYDYDAFGSMVGSSGTTVNNFMYRGEQTDSTLGLQYLRARWMDLAKGRFWSRDTWESVSGNPINAHPYQYASQRPLDLIDSSGHCVDPAGLFPSSGTRICINTFIPFGLGGNFGHGILDTIVGPLFVGDARGAASDGGSYRTAQYILIEPDTTLWSTWRKGSSCFTGTDLCVTAAAGDVQPDVQRLGANGVEAMMSASDGWLFGAAPSLRYDFAINIRSLFQGVIGWRTDFPSVEIWAYQDNRAPLLMYYYDASTKSLADIFHTSGVSFGDNANPFSYVGGGYTGINSPPPAGGF